MKTSVTRYIIMKYQNTLKSFQGENWSHAQNQESNCLPALNRNFGSRQCSNVFKILKENYFQLRILYLVKLSIKSKAGKKDIFRHKLSNIYLPCTPPRKLPKQGCKSRKRQMWNTNKQEIHYRRGKGNPQDDDEGRS